MNKYSLALAIFLLAIWGLVLASNPTAYAEATGGKIVTPRDGAIVTEGEMVLVRVVTFPGQLEEGQDIICVLTPFSKCEAGSEKLELPLIELHGNLAVFEWGVKRPCVYLLRASLQTSTKGEIIFGNNLVTAVSAFK